MPYLELVVLLGLLIVFSRWQLGIDPRNPTVSFFTPKEAPNIFTRSMVVSDLGTS